MVCLQVFFLLLLLSMWVLFSLFFSNLYFYLFDSLFPLLHLAVLFYTYSCCVPGLILDSVVFVYFPSLFLLSSLESHISLSSFSIRNSCPLSHHHRYCTNCLFSFNHFLVNFLYTHTWGWQKCSWYFSLFPHCLILSVLPFHFTCYYWFGVLVEGTFPSSATSHNSCLQPKAPRFLQWNRQQGYRNRAGK